MMAHPHGCQNACESRVSVQYTTNHRVYSFSALSMAISYMQARRIPQKASVELLGYILSYHTDVFLKDPAFRFLLKERLCPIVIKLLRTVDSFHVLLSLMRIVSTLLSSFLSTFGMECEILLSHVIRKLPSPSHSAPDGGAVASSETYAPTWHNALAVETLCSVFDNTAWILDAFTILDTGSSGSSVVSSMVQRLADIVGEQIFR